MKGNDFESPDLTVEQVLRRFDGTVVPSIGYEMPRMTLTPTSTHLGYSHFSESGMPRSTAWEYLHTRGYPILALLHDAQNEDLLDDERREALRILAHGIGLWRDACEAGAVNYPLSMEWPRDAIPDLDLLDDYALMLISVELPGRNDMDHIGIIRIASAAFGLHGLRWCLEEYLRSSILSVEPISRTWEGEVNWWLNRLTPKHVTAVLAGETTHPELLEPLCRLIRSWDANNAVRSEFLAQLPDAEDSLTLYSGSVIRMMARHWQYLANAFAFRLPDAWNKIDSSPYGKDAHE